MIRREKEEELIFRGNQYARAINQYQRKFANASPASLDVLIEQRMLRKKFRDPMSPNKDGEFQMLYLQNQATMGTPGPGQGQAGQGAGAGSKRARCRWTAAALQSAARSGPRRAAAAQSSASPARTPASRSGSTRARTTTTSGSSSEWRCPHRRGPGGRPGQRGGPQRGGPGGRDGGGSREADERVAPQSQRAMAPSRFRQAGRRAVHPHAAPITPRRATPAGSAESPCSRASDSRDS